MAHLINKDAIIAEIDKRIHQLTDAAFDSMIGRNLIEIKNFINTLEVKDSHEQCIQYDSIKAGIQAHAETYSFNIESELFNQLTKKQQVLWKKEIEQACISGGDAGYLLAKDPRYKENLEVKEVNLEEELNKWRHNHFHGRRDKDASGEYLERISQLELAKHFFELGMQQSKNYNNNEE